MTTALLLASDAAPAAALAPLFSVDSAIALLTLVVMEVVLGIDNIVFLSILVAKLPEAQRAKARFIGLAVAMLARIVLLLSISWLMTLTKPLFEVGPFWFLEAAHAVTGKDIVLFLGGLFLLYKATVEIHHKIDEKESAAGETPAESRHIRAASFAGIIFQIVMIDIVFSLDSVITAVGMADHIEIMIVAVVFAVVVMMLMAGAISRFIERHPTIKMLALAFLMLIGVMLVADGLGQHIPRGYIYSAMVFSILVEMLNMKASRKGVPAGAGGAG